MIISRSLNAIFVKTRKTAGTSVELAMSTACGPEDVISPLRDEDEQLRAQLGGRGPQHFLKSRGDDAMWNVAGMLSGGRHGQQYYNHAPAAVAIQHLGWETWESYFTFTVERDPWDKAVSRYFWEAAGRQVPDFSAFLRQCPRWSLTNFDLYAVDGEVVVDRVLRYERLVDELADVWCRLGVAPRALPHAKAGHRPQWATAAEMFTDADCEFIAEVCQREIAAFGYTPPRLSE